MECKYICPNCRAKMSEEEREFVCENNHHFDKSSEGYVNLALAKSSSDNSGDAADACRARRRFLELGFYKSLAVKIAQLIKESGITDGLAVDAGCGEGYYDRVIKTEIEKLDIYGIDLAKKAVGMAAKLEKSKENKNHYAVAGIFDMPFDDQSAKAVLSVFAPVPDKEAHRILEKDGILIVASPGKEHLFGLKKALYDTPEENEEKTPDFEGFTLVKSENLTYDMRLDGISARDLFAMTPYYWRSSAEIREKSQHLGEVESKADFRIKVYKKYVPFQDNFTR